MDKYLNRSEAGKTLAQALQSYANKKDVLVLALPRGGVPVAYEIAKALHLPLDVFIVRKLGAPGQPELAIGAIASDGTVVFNQDIIENLQVTQDELAAVITQEAEELHRREMTYRGKAAFPTIKDKAIILVDDGIATGASMRAAIKALRVQQASQIVVAVPVADKSLSEEFEKSVDALICPMRPIHFYAVGNWYEHFPQTDDNEVCALLSEFR
jgi:putative phosphoribosyl transferase